MHWLRHLTATRSRRRPSVKGGVTASVVGGGWVPVGVVLHGRVLKASSETPPVQLNSMLNIRLATLQTAPESRRKKPAHLRLTVLIINS